MIAPRTLIRALVGAALLGGIALAGDSEISEAEMHSLRAEVRHASAAPLLTEAEEGRQLRREAHRWAIANERTPLLTEAEEMRQLRMLHRELLLARERTPELATGER